MDSRVFICLHNPITENNIYIYTHAPHPLIIRLQNNLRASIEHNTKLLRCYQIYAWVIFISKHKQETLKTDKNP
jgi:hypothetical protein